MGYSNLERPAAHAAPGRYAIQAALGEGDVRTVDVEVAAAGDAPAVEIRLEP